MVGNLVGGVVGYVVYLLLQVSPSLATLGVLTFLAWMIFAVRMQQGGPAVPIYMIACNAALVILSSSIASGGDASGILMTRLFQFSIACAFAVGMMILIWDAQHRVGKSAARGDGMSTTSEDLSGTFDLIVLGGGPAGASGAASAGFLGKRAALIEKARAAGRRRHQYRHHPEQDAARDGSGPVRLAVAAAARRRSVAPARGDGRRFHAATPTMSRTPNRARVEARLDQRGVTRFRGAGSFVDPHTVRVPHERRRKTLLRGDRILIATGSSPFRPPQFPFDDDRVHDSDEILELDDDAEEARRHRRRRHRQRICRHLRRARRRGAPGRWPRCPDAVSRRGDRAGSRPTAMAANGVQFHWNERVTACDASRPGDVILHFASGATLSCDGVLVCAGRQSNTADLESRRGRHHSGQSRPRAGQRALSEPACRTSMRPATSIGPPALAATGIEQARVAVAMPSMRSHQERSRDVPADRDLHDSRGQHGRRDRGVAAPRGVDFIVGRARYADIARGEIIGDQTGFLKLLFRREDMRLLGVHVMGEQATELIHIGLMALLAGAGAELFNRACFNYPTLGDLYKYATYDALSQRDPSP